MRGLRRPWLVCAAVALALIAARPAGADVAVEMAGATLRVTAPGDRRTSIFIEHFADSSRNGVRVREHSTFPGHAPITSEDADCTHNPFANDVVCTPFPSRGEVTTGEANDFVGIGGSNVGCEPAAGTPFAVNLGGGADALGGGGCGGDFAGVHRIHPIFSPGRGGPGDDRLEGGNLDDRLLGEGGSDDVIGHRGDDELFGGTESDLLDGGDGNDVLDGQGGRDEMLGWGGIDTASYAARGSPVTVTLDNLDNDGAASEGDLVHNIESVIGGAGGDDLIGNAGPNTLEGRDGADEIVGAAGADVLRGGSGNDLIDSRDDPPVGETVSCGSGYDTVIADLEDTVPPRHPFSDVLCESITRFALDDGPPARILGRSVQIRRDRFLGVRLRCPRRAGVTCAGTLRLSLAGRTQSALARRRYAVRRGTTGRLRVRLSRRSVVRALARGTVVAATLERGLSEKGPRSTIHSLRVRGGRPAAG